MLAGNTPSLFSAGKQTRQVILSTVGAGTWTVPLDWSNSNNTIECIAGGGGGCAGSASVASRRGGGGGAYSASSNLIFTVGNVINFSVGAAGVGGVANGSPGSAGGDTFFGSTTLTGASVGAKGGAGATSSVSGAGGAASGGVGTTRYNGGSGGNTDGSGGGGAGGPHGNGGAGGIIGSGSAGGGGGGGGGSAGASGPSTGIGGNGGNNWNSVGGGVGDNGAGNNGTNGGGGAGGGAISIGGDGGPGTEWTTAGSGGGGGAGGGGAGAVAAKGGVGGLYGGAGGGGNASGAAFGAGGNGAQGIIVITYSNAPPAVSGGNDSFTKILLHMDGADNGTTFTEVGAGASAHTWNANSARTQTAQKKFGTASAFFDSSGTGIGCVDNADFSLGNGDFTFDCWFYVSGGSGTRRALFGHQEAAGGNGQIQFELNTSNVLSVMLFTAATTYTTIVGVTPITSSGWHHAAVVRSGGFVLIFLDGVLEKVQAYSSTLFDAASPFFIGSPGGYPNYFWNGYIDEFRFSKGIARWTGNFTPPSTQYV